jgi:hypothetical protein
MNSPGGTEESYKTLGQPSSVPGFEKGSAEQEAGVLTCTENCCFIQAFTVLSLQSVYLYHVKTYFEGRCSG